MNRILLTLLRISIAVLPVRGQDPGPVPPATGAIDPSSDSITPASDTVPPATEPARPEFKPVYREADTLRRDPDTLRRGPDTLLRETDAVRREFDTIPRVMQTGIVTADTLEVEEPDFSHSPSKAMMYALVLPGLGQAYNKKYFKIPIVYAGLGAAVYAINYNSTNYRIASQEYAEEQNDLNERYLRTWRRWMEISYIALAAVYALQVLDAYVDAHLYSWDVNQNLSLRIAPSLQPVMVPGKIPVHQLGLACRFELKGR